MMCENKTEAEIVIRLIKVVTEKDRERMEKKCTEIEVNISGSCIMDV